MNPIRHIRRLAGALAALACAWLGLADAAPAAFASAQHPRPSWFTSPPRILPARALAWIRAHLPPGWNKHPPPPAHVHALAAGGMPGWQITLIAAAVLAAIATVVLLARAARQRGAASPA